MADKEYFVRCDFPAFKDSCKAPDKDTAWDLATEELNDWFLSCFNPDWEIFESEDAYHRREALVTFAPTDEHHALLYIDGDPNSECEFDVEADVWKASPELTSVVDLEHCEHGDYFLFCGSVASAICAAIRQGHVRRYHDTGHELVKRVASTCYVCGHQVTPYHADRLICTVCHASLFGGMGPTPEVQQSRRVNKSWRTGYE